MTGNAREQTSGAVSFEMPPVECFRRLNGFDAETRESPGMMRHVCGRREDLTNQFAGVSDERSENIDVCTLIGRKRCGGSFDRMFQDSGGSIIERMRQRRRRLNPFQTILLQRKAFKER